MTYDNDQKIERTGDTLRHTFKPADDDTFTALLAALDASIIDAAIKVIDDRR
ncbi:hypothetical protein ACXY7D_11890 [Sphingomonas melonis]